MLHGQVLGASLSPSPQMRLHLSLSLSCIANVSSISSSLLFNRLVFDLDLDSVLVSTLGTICNFVQQLSLRFS
ncbi:hypothetical protein ACLKA6_006396 [Drosophila palustris]